MNAAAEIDEARIAFNAICDMEFPLLEATELARAIALIVADMEGDEAAMLAVLMGMMLGKCRNLERLRGEAFHLTHPNRDHFEKVGWPSDQEASA